MNKAIKKVAVISAKNAVNAILTNGALMTTLGSWSQVHSRAGWVAIGHVTLACVISREAIIWVPKLLTWSQSVTNGNEVPKP